MKWSPHPKAGVRKASSFVDRASNLLNKALNSMTLAGFRWIKRICKVTSKLKRVWWGAAAVRGVFSCG